MGHARYMGDLHKGEFFQQGGFITIYPINSEAPITIEFSANIIKFAKELLVLYKTRSEIKRPPYEPSHFEKSVWDNFEFEETPSQKTAIEDIFLDMAKAEPMERLVVGDVGFGKTEIALRAARGAVLNGKQVVILSPTTVLADQHSETFRKRLAREGIEIERLTRLESREKTMEILRKIKDGKIDIVVGTHRILSKDLNFKNL